MVLFKVTLMALYFLTAILTYCDRLTVWFLWPFLALVQFWDTVRFYQRAKREGKWQEK